jgi:hypothetical protein
MLFLPLRMKTNPSKREATHETLSLKTAEYEAEALMLRRSSSNRQEASLSGGLSLFRFLRLRYGSAS